MSDNENGPKLLAPTTSSRWFAKRFRRFALLAVLVMLGIGCGARSGLSEREFERDAGRDLQAEARRPFAGVMSLIYDTFSGPEPIWQTSAAFRGWRPGSDAGSGGSEAVPINEACSFWPGTASGLREAVSAGDLTLRDSSGREHTERPSPFVIDGHRFFYRPGLFFPRDLDPKGELVLTASGDDVPAFRLSFPALPQFPAGRAELCTAYSRTLGCSFTVADTPSNARVRIVIGSADTVGFKSAIVCQFPAAGTLQGQLPALADWLGSPSSVGVSIQWEVLETKEDPWLRFDLTRGRGVSAQTLPVVGNP